MSRGIIARRELLIATNRLVNAREPELEHFTAVTQALAQILTDELTIECKVVLKCGAHDLKKLLEKTS